MEYISVYQTWSNLQRNKEGKQRRPLGLLSTHVPSMLWHDRMGIITRRISILPLKNLELPLPI
jgi:hypothetical protein